MKQVKQQHTPGPYEAWPVKNDRLKRWDVVCVNPDYCPGTGKTVLAERVRTKANARLFAAAPELLEALKAVERWSFDTATEIPPGLYASMRTALAKAEPSGVEACSSPAIYCQQMGRAKRVKPSFEIIEISSGPAKEGKV
jgi:hypothetical protein